MREHLRRVVALLTMATLVVMVLLLIPDGAGGHGVPQPKCDFITGGGWVVTDGGAKGTYGAHGGCKHEDFWGHVNYVDHNTSPGFHVRSTEITGYLSPSGLTSDPERDICAIGVVVSRVPPHLPRVRASGSGQRCGTITNPVASTTGGSG